MNKTTLIILGVICAIIFIAPLVMYHGHGEDDGYFGGADDAAGDAINESHRSNHCWLLPGLLERSEKRRLINFLLFFFF